MNPFYLSPKVKVGFSDIHRKGLFAKEPIKKGAIVVIVGGCVIAKEGLNKKALRGYVFKIAPGFYLVPCNKGKPNSDDYLNHSCNPNVGIKGSIIFTAMRDILTGEELTYDYAATDNDPDDYFECHCREKNCRKVITGKDWKNPVLQKKYEGYFAWYIYDSISKS